MVELGQSRAQHARQIVDLGCAHIAEAGHVPARVNVGGERSRRGVQFERDEVLGNRDDAGLFLQFLFQHLTEHALAKVVKVSYRLLKALTHLERGHGRRDHLGVRVFQAGASVDSMILEDRNVRDARIEAEFIVASLIDMEDFRHVGIGHQGQNLSVVGRLHDHIVNPEAVYRPA